MEQTVSPYASLDELYEAEPVGIRLVFKRLKHPQMESVALRWHLRGLSIEHVIRKAKLDDRLYRKVK